MVPSSGLFALCRARAGLSASAIGTRWPPTGWACSLVGGCWRPPLRSLSIGMAIAMGPLVSVAAAGGDGGARSGILHRSEGASFSLFGSGPILWTISQTTLRQTVTPDALLGRVSALFMTASAGSRPIGAAIGAAVGAASGSPRRPSFWPRWLHGAGARDTWSRCRGLRGCRSGR